MSLIASASVRSAIARVLGSASWTSLAASKPAGVRWYVRCRTFSNKPSPTMPPLTFARSISTRIFSESGCWCSYPRSPHDRGSRSHALIRRSSAVNDFRRSPPVNSNAAKRTFSRSPLEARVFLPPSLVVMTFPLGQAATVALGGYMARSSSTSAEQFAPASDSLLQDALPRNQDVGSRPCV